MHAGRHGYERSGPRWGAVYCVQRSSAWADIQCLRDSALSFSPWRETAATEGDKLKNIHYAASHSGKRLSHLGLHPLGSREESTVYTSAEVSAGNVIYGDTQSPDYVIPLGGMSNACLGGGTTVRVDVWRRGG